MKSIKLAFLFTLITLGSLSSQDLNLTELKAPSSPAFTILGIQPTEIARPTSFDAFKANLINDFTNDDGFTLPQNLALEFSPYWIFSHKDLTFEKMLDPSSNNVLTNTMRSSSFSIASIKIENPLDSIANGTRLGIGYRAMLLKGSPSKKNKEKLLVALEELNEEQQQVLGVFNPLQQLAFGVFTDFETFISAIPNEMESFYRFQSFSPSTKGIIDKELEEVIIPFLQKSHESKPIDTADKLKNLINVDLPKELSDFEAKLKTKAKAVQDLIDINGDNYQGFFLELAGSVAIDFSNNKFNNSRATKWGFWLTPSYRFENEKFEFLGVVRFIKNEVLENSISDNFDIGGKLVFEKDKLSFSGEFIQRFQYAEKMDGSGDLQSKNDLKAVLNIEYKLIDNILLTYTFGENFDMNSEVDGNLISTIGLSYRIGGSTKDIKLF